jgi:hypothetical protein
MIEKRADQRRIDVFEHNRGWRLSEPSVRPGEKQAKRIAVGCHGVRACPSLAHQPLGEERFQQGRQRPGMAHPHGDLAS